MKKLIDYKEAGEFSASNYPFVEPIVAQGQGHCFIAIYELDEPVERFDGKKGYYSVDDRYLSQACEDASDQAWACVQANETIFLTKAEMKPIFKAIQEDAEFNVFEHLVI